MRFSETQDLSGLERRLRDAEANRRKAEADLARQDRLCQQLSEANEKLAQSAVGAAKDLEREKLLIQSRCQKQIDELSKRLRDGDEDMERVRITEQNQRLQLLDEVSLDGHAVSRTSWANLCVSQLNSAQEKIDKLNTQLRARGG